MPSAPVWRPTARLIVLDPLDRILLFRFTDRTGRIGWFTPGGGLHKGETPEAGAARELAEETGFVVTAAGAGPVVATCGGQWRAEDGTVFFGADSFFLVRVADAAVRTDGQEALERSIITGHRWWSVAEMAEAEDRIVPAALPGLVAQLLDSGIPDWPVRLPWRDLG
jgi:8-oxo-dGTP pyrophosphatase MutT (NUDIX family)